MNSELFSTLSRLSSETRSALREELRERLIRRERENRIASLYPDEPHLLARDKYQKHLEFFAAGLEHQERCFMAANRVGKTTVGAYEVACHATGVYPSWWVGRRFSEPVEVWAAGDTSETTRDVVQLELFGPKEDIGTGMVPKRFIMGEPSARRGVADAIDTAKIKHSSGGSSYIGLKSYDQGRKKFQGTKKHVIWLDEEPEAPIYDECMLRIMTTNGLMLCTFTPLEGLTEIALRYLPNMAPVMSDGNVR